MSVLRRTNMNELRHRRTVCQPSLIQGVVSILLLACLWCAVGWISSYRNKLQRHSAPKKSQKGHDECPFTIRQLNKTTYLIRENDQFGEYPHIYVKKHTETLPNGQRASVFIVNDTGCGTTTRTHTTKNHEWNIQTFIEHHLNPNNDNIPYLIILSHCHYDHILGLDPFLHPTQHHRSTTISSSSHDRNFLHPQSHLIQHSLCASMNLQCPNYTTTFWAHDHHRLTIPHPQLTTPLLLPITTLHTPGHTPDSLSWYDEDERALYVGDSLYERESMESRCSPWGREAPAPILFPSEGDLTEWWRSVHVLLGFVGEKNKMVGRGRVTLSPGHVSVGVDAVVCLLGVNGFMARVLRGDVEVQEQPEKRGERFGSWVEEGGRFSLGAPLRVVEEGRLGIPEDEWRYCEKLG